jgi:UDP-N-acetyl-2-amino-2-deoxyglucuronate dehydrogenase
MNKIKIAIIGCGRVSKYHIEAINNLKKKYDLVSVCDSDQLKLDEVKKNLNIPLYKDLEEMLKNEEIDILSICTPNGLHFKHAMIASKYSIDILTEKPLTTSWDEGVKMVNLFKEKKLNLYVIKQNRYNPTLVKLKKAIDAKRFGKIHMINVNVFWTRPQNYYDQAAWRGTKDLDGGALMNQASHYIDLLHWLGGPIKKIQSICSTFLKIEVEDTSVINIEWESGAIGSMSVTMLTYPANYEGSVTVVGENGLAKISGVACNKIEEWKFIDESDDDIKINKVNYEPKDVYGNGHRLYYDRLYDIHLNNLPSEIDGKEGLKTLEIITAAYISADKNITVNLPLEKK